MTHQTSRDLGPNVSEHDSKVMMARRQVSAIKGFYIHFFTFVLVMLGLCAINFAVGRPWWALWVFVGWGIGVLAHALTVFGRTSKWIADWEERKIREFSSGR